MDTLHVARGPQIIVVFSSYFPSARVAHWELQRQQGRAKLNFSKFWMCISTFWMLWFAADWTSEKRSRKSSEETKQRQERTVPRQGWQSHPYDLEGGWDGNGRPWELVGKQGVCTSALSNFAKNFLRYTWIKQISLFLLSKGAWFSHSLQFWIASLELATAWTTDDISNIPQIEFIIPEKDNKPHAYCSTPKEKNSRTSYL